MSARISAREIAAVRRWLPLIVGLAIGLRLALALMHPIGLPRDVKPGHWEGERAGQFEDSADYLALGLALAHGQAYEVNGRSEVRMPGYPVFVAGIFALTGDSVKAVLVAQGLLGGGCVVLTYILGRRIGVVAGLAAAALAACDPLSVAFAATLLSEIPFAFVLLLALWVSLRIVETAGEPSENGRFWLRWVVLGLLWGVAVYLRAEALYGIVPLAAWIVFRGCKAVPKKGIRFGAGGTVAVLVVFVCLMPWLIRNYTQFHSGFFRLTSLEGISLYEAVYPNADGAPKQGQIALTPEMQSMNEAQQNDAWAHQAWQFVRDDPLRIARLAGVKIGRTWSPFLNAAGYQARPIQVGLAMWYVPLFVLGLSGIFTHRVSHGLRGLLLIPVLYFTAVHAVFLGSVRYRVPLMPVVCVLAGIGLWNIVKSLGGAKRWEGRAV
jgi:hypothetical protein